MPKKRVLIHPMRQKAIALTLTGIHDHQTAKLYRLATIDERVMAEVGLHQQAWAARIAVGLAAPALEDAEHILQLLCTRLEHEPITKEVLA